MQPRWSRPGVRNRANMKHGEVRREAPHYRLHCGDRHGVHSPGVAPQTRHAPPHYRMDVCPLERLPHTPVMKASSTPKKATAWRRASSRSATAASCTWNTNGLEPHHDGYHSSREYSAWMACSRAASCSIARYRCHGLDGSSEARRLARASTRDIPGRPPDGSSRCHPAPSTLCRRRSTWLTIRFWKSAADTNNWTNWAVCNMGWGGRELCACVTPGPPARRLRRMAVERSHPFAQWLLPAVPPRSGAKLNTQTTRMTRDRGRRPFGQGLRRTPVHAKLGADCVRLAQENHLALLWLQAQSRRQLV